MFAPSTRTMRILRGHSGPSILDEREKGLHRTFAPSPRNHRRRGGRGLHQSATIGLHPELHGALAAGTDLRIQDADGADTAKILGGLEPPVTFDLERGNLEVGDAGESPAVELGPAVAEPLIEEEGPAGIVLEQRGNRTILAQQNHFSGGRVGSTFTSIPSVRSAEARVTTLPRRVTSSPLDAPDAC